MKNNELCVAPEAFAVGEEGATMPGDGEVVEFTGRGTVRMQDGKAYVTATEINGQPVEERGSPKSLDEEETEMRAAAEAADAIV